jgi:hypothetical protein
LVDIAPKVDGQAGNTRTKGDIFVPKDQTNIECKWVSMNRKKKIEYYQDEQLCPWRFEKFTDTIRYMFYFPESPFWDPKYSKIQTNSDKHFYLSFSNKESNHEYDEGQFKLMRIRKQVSVDQFLKKHRFVSDKEYDRKRYDFHRVSNKKLTTKSREK